MVPEVSSECAMHGYLSIFVLHKLHVYYVQIAAVFKGNLRAKICSMLVESLKPELHYSLLFWFSGCKIQTCQLKLVGYNKAHKISNICTS